MPCPSKGIENCWPQLGSCRRLDYSLSGDMKEPARWNDPIDGEIRKAEQTACTRTTLSTMTDLKNGETRDECGPEKGAAVGEEDAPRDASLHQKKRRDSTREKKI